MIRRRPPTDNVWFPADVDEDTAVGVIASYFQRHADNYEDRLLVLPYKDELDEAHGAGENLFKYAANGNLGSPRGKRGNPGGPVLVIPTDLRQLDQAIRLAGDQLLGVREYIPGSLSGWATAAGALNLATGERQADVPDAVRQILKDLMREGNNGYPKPKQGTAYKAMVELHIGKLQTLGYTADFVAGYLVGAGVTGNRAEDLKRIYGQMA
jgi:hypothetical protein